MPETSSLVEDPGSRWGPSQSRIKLDLVATDRAIDVDSGTLDSLDGAHLPWRIGWGSRTGWQPDPAMARSASGGCTKIALICKTFRIRMVSVAHYA